MIETKYSKILVGVDGSKESMRAVDHAIGLAKKDKSELICLTALQLPSFYGWSAIEADGAIVNYADNENVDLIVVGIRGRSGFAKKLLGSVALGVVTHASCPVIVIK